MENNKIISSVKDEGLITKRRNQMIQGAMRLFQEKGFHRTTTREIAQESGFSIGTLYEYIRKKEDVLFLVCDYIYDEVGDRFESAMKHENLTRESVESVIRAFYQHMDEMQEEILVLYQEIKGLNKETRKHVLKKEKEMVEMLAKLIRSSYPNIDVETSRLASNNIFVQGHMWAFRRWALQRHFTIDAYTNAQIKLNLHGLLHVKS
jgi:AcrR family transcriptional regulator